MSGPWIAAFAALWLVVPAEAIVLLGFLRRAVTVLEAAESQLRGSSLAIGGAAPGTRIPSFEVRDADGRPVPWSELAVGPTVVFFASADCHACHSLLEELNTRGWDERDSPLIAILNDTVEDRAIAFGAGVVPFYQSNRSAAEAFESIATPQAFAVDTDGTVTDSRVPQSIDDLRLLAQSLKGGGATAASQPVELVHT